MTKFVHLSSENNTHSILRSGIRVRSGSANLPAGVFAMPVIRNFFVTHQWLRELKRGGERTIVGIYFRIADEEPVWFGRYNQCHQELTAAVAAARLASLETGEALGYEVVIPRKIEPQEIVTVRHLPQVLGWRYYPEAHGRRPCGCPICIPSGAIRSRRLRKQFEQGLL